MIELTHVLKINQAVWKHRDGKGGPVWCSVPAHNFALPVAGARMVGDMLQVKTPSGHWMLPTKVWKE